MVEAIIVVWLVLLTIRVLWIGGHQRAHCRQVGKLQRQLYEVDPVKFREYSPEEFGEKRE